MRRGIGLALLFLLVFAVTLAIRLPLRWALPLLPNALQCTEPAGSIWSGSCHGLSHSTAGISLTDVEWALQPARLLHGQLVLDVRARRGDAMASGLLQWSPGRVEMRDWTGGGSLEPGLPPPLAGWTGRLAFESLNLRLAAGKLESVDGRLETHDLRSPKGLDWGSYRIDIPHSRGAGIAPGRLVSIDGPLRLQGTVQVNPAQRSWQLDVRLAVQPGTSPDLENALGALAPPDQEGLRPLSVAGAF